MESCLFCKIIEGKIPSTKVYEDEEVLAFKDIHPLANIHYLFIHKNHSENIMGLMKQPHELLAIFKAIELVAKKEKIDQSGFRLVNNCGALAGQTVFHTHFHLLAGQNLGPFGA